MESTKRKMGQIIKILTFVLSCFSSIFVELFLFAARDMSLLKYFLLSTKDYNDTIKS